jgi:hypothetical protein
LFIFKISADGTKVKTIIKKVTGNRDVFIQELRAQFQLNKAEDIRVLTGGAIEVNKHLVRDVKKWLGGLGF